MILHTINASPASQAFTDCLRIITDEDVVLLLGDAVYAGIENSDASSALYNCGARVCVLRADATASGISVQPGFELVDMDGFVSLSEQFPRQQAWF